MSNYIINSILKLKRLILLLLLSVSIFTHSQVSRVALSGVVFDDFSKNPIPFANVIIKNSSDSLFLTGGITNDFGEFNIEVGAESGYIVEISFIGYHPLTKSIYVGDGSNYLDLGKFFMTTETQELGEVEISAKEADVSSKMDKKSFKIEENLSQTGGSVLQAMQNLPSVTIQDGKVMIRGNSNVIVLIDGKQSAITGFGNQSGLENIPASAIDKIEIINNPSAKNEANGSGGIINIILKKENKNGFNGKVGISIGAGAFWIKKQNLPSIRPQYQFTPKVNPSLSLNYRNNKFNVFLQADYLYTHTLNKNEFVTRTYDDGTIINQQTMRNRNTGFLNVKIGFDFDFSDRNKLTVFGMFSSEDIIDKGDEPFFNADLSTRLRLWRFTEDELKTTGIAAINFEHKFKQPGHEVVINGNYTFHRENEQYYFQNIYPSFEDLDSFKLISDEQVLNTSIDYVKPLKYGKIEAGINFRYRYIPTNMLFIPGDSSQFDSSAGGWANYREVIPAIYGDYIFQSRKFDAQIGVRLEYVNVDYLVNPNHPTYSSDGYQYIQPFPNVNLGYRINQNNKISLAYNRRVTRPNEVDIRIFPKYDDAEIIKVGNPALHPEFTDKIEFGYKLTFRKGYFYSAIYGLITDGTITRIGVIVPGETTIYNVFQNAGRSYNTGLELVFSEKFLKWLDFSVNGNVYYNQINDFQVINKYPILDTINIAKQATVSGNIKLNISFHFKKSFDMQISVRYLAPDVIPQGKIGSRFSFDIGFQKLIQKGKGVLFLNATDLFNTMNIKQEFYGSGFKYASSNYYETQVIRIGYKYRF
ncbi:MAG: TonB-dependent receptor [Crocinitomicaceae bacterium]